MAPSIVDILLRAKNLASKELNQVTSQLQGLDKAAKFAAGGLSMMAGGFAIQQAVKFAAEMAQLNTQVERSAYAFEHFSGGAAQAAANMRAVQRASGGTLTTLEAQNVAVVGLTQKLASNSQELEKMTRIARGIVSISPMINDVETAFSQLGLTIANQSMMRLDQLGTSAVEVRAKMAELKAETKGLTEEQAFQDALISILETKFNDLTDAAVNQASGLEVLRKAWIDYRITAAESFGWFDKLARRMGQELNVETQLRGAQRLIESLPPVVSPEQLAVVRDIQKILDEPLDAGDSWVEIGEQLDKLIDKYYDLADARMNFFKGLAVGPQIDFPVDDPMFTTEQDQKRLQTLEDFNKQVEKLIETQARAAQIKVFEETGDIEKATRAYDVATESLNYWVSKQMRLLDLPIEEKIAVITNLLPAAASGMVTVATAVGEIKPEPVEKLGAAMQGLEGFINGASGAMRGFIRDSVVAQAAAVNLAGAIGAAFDTMSEVAGDRSGAGFGKLSGMIKTPLAIGDGMKAIALESGAAASGVSRVNSEFENLKSTISGIVSGAIGPVAGVDANDLLPREDAVNENARRLADIAVNGFKGQDWLDEFKNEVPDVYQALVESGDPKTAAATMLKDFQDGLINGTGVLIDKERAKDLVRRALLGQSNTQSLINEIAQELAAETGTAFSTVQAQAQSILGGSGGLSSDNGTGAAFSRGMVDGVSNSTLGADLGGVVMAQITASVALIEDSGREAGRALVRGVTATFTDIPAAFIAQVAALVTPAVQASINQNGGRTGAAAV